MYAKLHNVVLEIAGKEIAYDGKLYINPTPENLKRAGYKEVKETEMLPEKKWFYQKKEYTQDDNYIYQTYVYVKSPLPDKEILVEEKIRTKYTLNDELAIQRRRETDQDKFAEYNSDVETFIAAAEAEISEWENAQ